MTINDRAIMDHCTFVGSISLVSAPFHFSFVRFGTSIPSVVKLECNSIRTEIDHQSSTFSRKGLHYSQVVVNESIVDAINTIQQYISFF